MTPSTVDPSREESVFFVALVGGEPYQSRNKSVQKSGKITYPPKIYHPLPTNQKYYPAPSYKKYRLKGKNGIFKKPISSILSTPSPLSPTLNPPIPQSRSTHKNKNLF